MEPNTKPSPRGCECDLCHEMILSGNIAVLRLRDHRHYLCPACVLRTFEQMFVGEDDDPVWDHQEPTP
jgi:hypothetical protein